MSISFSVSNTEQNIIREIVRRAWAHEFVRKAHELPAYMEMDICAVHANGNPLRLADFLAADDFNFLHDISGIINCLDRETGQLRNHFMPRFSRH